MSEPNTFLPTRPTVYMVAENESDMLTCLAIATKLRRNNIVADLPFAHRAVNKQLKKATALEASKIAVVNGDTTSIRYVGIPVKMDFATVDAAAVLIELESDDDGDDPRIVNLASRLMSDHYLWGMGFRPTWDTWSTDRGTPPVFTPLHLPEKQKEVVTLKAIFDLVKTYFIQTYKSLFSK